jgi:porin
MDILLFASMLVLVAGRLSPAQAQASDGLAPAAPYLLGDWGGKRQALEDRGLTFEVAVITDQHASGRNGA